MRALALAAALLLGGATPAAAQIIGPVTSTTEAPTTTAAPTTTVAPTTAPTTAPAPTTTRRPATTTTASTAPPSTQPAFVPPQGSPVTSPPTTAPEPAGDPGRRVLPILVLLSIGGFALAALIVGAQVVATRPPKPKRPPRKAPLKAK